MCDEYTPCNCLFPKEHPHKPLTLLLLDCWQREYDERPYRKFVFKRLDFEERMRRPYLIYNDFAVIVHFVQERPLGSVTLVGVRLPEYRPHLLHDFMHSLQKLRTIELKLTDIPLKFFQLLKENAVDMRVRHLSFEGSALNNDDVTELRSFMLVSQTLQSLNVANCSISQFYFVMVADGVYNSQSLRSLNCSHLIGDKLTLDTMKIAHILSSLIGQNKLHELVLQHCEFNAHDMETLSEYLETPRSVLRKLDVAYNMMGASGAEILLRAVERSGTLTDLNLAGNKLGTHGGYVIAKYLSACRWLQHVDVTYNDIGAEAIDLILTAMKKPIKLLKLKVWGNHYDAKTGMVLHRLLCARVVPQNTIDITATFDDVTQEHRIIPYM